MNIICHLAVKLGMKENPIEPIKRKKENAQLNKAISDTPALLEEIKRYKTRTYTFAVF